MSIFFEQILARSFGVAAEVRPRLARGREGLAEVDRATARERGRPMRLRMSNGPRPRPIALQRSQGGSWYRIVNRATNGGVRAEARASVYLFDEIGGWGVTASVPSPWRTS